MLSGSYEYICRVPLLIVLSWMEEVLGTDTAVHLMRMLRWKEEVLGPPLHCL